MSQKKRRPNEFTIGYKAMVTDYLLYEDCCDYHLKLILAVWDGVTVQEEVKYFSYLICVWILACWLVRGPYTAI